MTAKGDADSTDPLTIKTQPFVIARRDLTFPQDRPSDLDLRSKVGTLRQGMTLPASVGPRGRARDRYRHLQRRPSDARQS
jgi:hypothetical protein